MPRSGRSSTSTSDHNVKKVKEIVLENHHSNHHVIVSLVDPANSDPTFMERIINAAETWIYEYNMQENQHQRIE
ncbi:unnamed protein product [Ceratitis capitata]|uniref:(Mediterranean fruit fly) hypothetical protein n=1 Tax=Ceratitis capitata TaxID=7213 RepID=A0A811UKG6_CERCA|nr:unnamed protein product [Ceratitis capitata]